MKIKSKQLQSNFELPKFQALVGTTVADLINLCSFYDINDLGNLSNNHTDIR